MEFIIEALVFYCVLIEALGKTQKLCPYLAKIRARYRRWKARRSRQD